MIVVTIWLVVSMALNVTLCAVLVSLGQEVRRLQSAVEAGGARQSQLVTIIVHPGEDVTLACPA